jgi:hypothetical protein
MEMTCGPCAYGQWAERVEQVDRTSGEGGVLRGSRFAFMACDCVAAVITPFAIYGPFGIRPFWPDPPLGARASYKYPITCSS